MRHELKILPIHFKDVKSGKKPFEVRVNDRPYEVGDELYLREFENGEYSGDSVLKKVTCLLDDERYCKENMVIMGVK